MTLAPALFHRFASRNQLCTCRSISLSSHRLPALSDNETLVDPGRASRAFGVRPCGTTCFSLERKRGN